MKRRLIEKDHCLICLHHLETVINVLWECEAARDVWCQSNRSIQKRASSFSCFLDLRAFLAASLTQQDLNEIAHISNLIWERHNNYVFNHQFSHPKFIIKKAQFDLHLLAAILSSRQDRCGNQNEVWLLSMWQRSPRDVLIVNWDASLDSINHRVCIDVVIRNHKAQILGAL